jgi:hypothetical protein
MGKKNYGNDGLIPLLYYSSLLDWFLPSTHTQIYIAPEQKTLGHFLCQQRVTKSGISKISKKVPDS